MASKERNTCRWNMFGFQARAGGVNNTLFFESQTTVMYLDLCVCVCVCVCVCFLTGIMTF